MLGLKLIHVRKRDPRRHVLLLTNKSVNFLVTFHTCRYVIFRLCSQWEHLTTMGNWTNLQIGFENQLSAISNPSSPCLRIFWKKWGNATPALWVNHDESWIISALPGLCVGNSLVTGEFPSQRPVTRGFDVFFDLRLNKRLSKQSWGWWCETPWCHYDVTVLSLVALVASLSTDIIQQMPLQSRHNECDGVSNHRRFHRLLNCWFRCRQKKSKLRVTGLCAGNSPVTGEFPIQKASNAENVSIWWRYHVYRETCDVSILNSFIRSGAWDIICSGYGLSPVRCQLILEPISTHCQLAPC